MRRIQTVMTRIREIAETWIRPWHGPAPMPLNSFLSKLPRMVLFPIHGFVRDKCALQASALTYNTLLSIVPVLALLFGIAKGFGLEQRLEELLYDQMAGQQEVVEKVVGFALVWLDDVRGGIVAGIGVIVMLWTAVNVLSRVESTFNHIWKVTPRSFIRKFTDYLTIMIISPLFFIVSSSLTVYIATQLTAMAHQVSVLQAVSPVIFLVFKFLPFALMWVLFSFVYMVMPNTRVNLASALMAGFIAGTAFQLLQQGYIHIMVLLSRYNAIYGSFAALPFFLIWMHLSWMIVLFGAQVAYFHQHTDLLSFSHTDNSSLSPGTQKKLALRIVHLVVRQFATGEPPLDEELIRRQTSLPASVVNQMITKLIQTRMIIAVATGPGSDKNRSGYLPSSDIHTITLSDFLTAWDGIGHTDIEICDGSEWEAVCRAFDAADEAVKNSPANLLIKNL